MSGRHRQFNGEIVFSFLLALLLLAITTLLALTWIDKGVEEQLPSRRVISESEDSHLISCNQVGQRIRAGAAELSGRTEFPAPVGTDTWNRAGSGFELISVRTITEIKASVQKYMWNKEYEAQNREAAEAVPSEAEEGVAAEIIEIKGR